MALPGDWLLLTLLTLVMWGLWGFFYKLATEHIGPMSVLVYSAVGTVVIALLVFWSKGFAPDYHVRGTGYALLGGLVAAVGTLSFAMAIGRGDISVATPIAALYPVVTIFLGVMVLGESFTLQELAGTVFAILAILFFSL